MDKDSIPAIIDGIITMAEYELTLVNHALGRIDIDHPDFDVLIQIRKDLKALIADQLHTQELYKTGEI